MVDGLRSGLFFESLIFILSADLARDVPETLVVGGNRLSDF